jgi:hypothetical protein
MNDAQWSKIRKDDARICVYIAYTRPGFKGPPPPSDDRNASMTYALRVGPPQPAERIIHATTTWAKYEEEEYGPDYIVVEMEEELSLSYRFGPTLPRSEFVLFRYTGEEGEMGFLSDNREQVLRWNKYAPKWRLVV